MFQWTEIFR